MRFAWLRRSQGGEREAGHVYSLPITLIRTAYNAVFWVFLIPFFTAISYSVGFAAMTVIVLARLGANLYANHVIKAHPGQYDRFPFRA